MSKERHRRKTLAEFYAVLNHDGFLILDQRNYDAILDSGYRCTQAFYYCGDDIVVEPEHVDGDLEPDSLVHVAEKSLT
jgi:hypothetical protein